MASQIMMKKDEQIVILEAVGLNGVCTNQHLIVTKAFGDTTPYLKDENFVYELGELLPDKVFVIVKAAACQVLASNQPVTLCGLEFSNAQSVEIAIYPFVTGASVARQLLLLFTPL